MKLQVNPDIFARFPGYVRHTLVVKDADNSQEDPELLQLLKDTEARLRTDPSFEDLKAHPLLASWRDTFTSFGVNPNKCPPSIANLVKRVRAGKELPYINTLVAIFNVVSMKYILPAGGDDLDKVVGDVCLTFANGEEKYTPLASPDVIENPVQGEIILMDTGNHEVFCRAWCWKNGDASKIEKNTKHVAINIDSLLPMTPDDGRAAAEETAELVKRFCGASVVIYRLDAEHCEVEI